MKAFIAVKNNKGIDSEVDERFGRAGYFLIYDLETDEVLSAEENRHKDGAQGVGIAVSNQIIQSGCELALGAQPGPKVDNILKTSKIEFFLAKNCTAKQAIEQYRDKLKVQK